MSLLRKKDEKPNRDSVTTIRDDGSRRFLHPSDVAGRFTKLRRVSAFLLILVYLALPWIKINGNPAIFLDVAERRFHIFGATLAAQDMWLLFFLITGVGFSLYMVTAVLGRVWCGWACPQTVFLEHVFRRVERWIEGDNVARKRLDASGWTSEKILKRGSKHVAYVICAAAITHLFLSYYVSLPRLWGMMTSAPGEHWSAFVFIAISTGILYFNFAWFREQLCIIICPYGRLQSALIDDNSLVIGYDSKRGEPRGKASAASAGACIDCNRCVQVCPTGIDIRQGLQIECIGCAACIDACDEVMVRLERPKGLIRYDSLNGLQGRITRIFRPRTFFYIVLFLIGVCVATWALSTVRPANLGITRMLGAPYYQDASTIRDQFMLRIVNKQTEAASYRIELLDMPPEILVGGTDQIIVVPAMGEVLHPLVIQMPVKAYKGSFKVSVRLSDAYGKFFIDREAEFIGPDPQLLKMTDTRVP